MLPHQNVDYNTPISQRVRIKLLTNKQQQNSPSGPFIDKAKKVKIQKQ